MRDLLAEIERVLPDGGEWTQMSTASQLAAIVVALRPEIVVEIGVWMGGSAIPMLLALKHVGRGRLIAIDPWANESSVIDQDGKNKLWWSSVDHNAAYRKFLARLQLHELSHLCTVCHRPSDQCEPPMGIQLLNIDGNHGAQAVRDVERFGSRVTMGGIMILDDLHWEGSHVEHAHDRAIELGFRDLYEIGGGIAMQRRNVDL